MINKTRTWRHITLAILAAGAVLSFAAMFGPIWVVRAGVVLAVLAGVGAAFAAWREISHHLTERRRALAEQNLALSRTHGDHLRTERKQNAAVLDTLRTQIERTNNLVDRLADEVSSRRTEIAELRREISGLRGDKLSLAAQVSERDDRIAGLRETLVVREAELAALLAEDDEAEVYAMPRRVRADGERIAPQAEWETAEQPSVVDLAMLETAYPQPKDADQRKQA